MAESKESTDVSSKVKGAALGAFLADAATMPLHWIYDQEKVAELAKTGIEFHDPPSCPFYEYKAGLLSPYGAENLPLLKSLVEEGKLDAAKAAVATKDFYTSYEGRLNHTAKALVASFEAGKVYPDCGDPADNQANALVRSVLVTARYFGSEDLEAQVEAAVRIQQNNDSAVENGKAASAVLAKVLSGASPHEAVEWAKGQPWAADLGVTKVLDRKDDELNVLAKEVGLSCQLPGALAVALAVVQRSKDYVDAIRLNATVGGDNCSRSGLIGAMWGAHTGAAGLPADWFAKWSSAADVTAQIDALVASRG